MNDETSSPQDAANDAEALFAAWLARVEAGEELQFHELLHERPALADALRQLHEDWQLFAPVLNNVVPGLIASGSGLETPFAGDDAGADSDEPPREVLARLGLRMPDASRYRFRAVIGKGGGGVVLKVWDTKLSRPLALKIVLGHACGGGRGNTPPVDHRTLARFVDEARIASQLNHPGIVPVHEIGADETGRVFFTMKLVQGDNLGAIFERVRTGSQGWTQARALGVLLRVCETVAYAHNCGVIHRDLKPANIMAGPYGEVYVMDWGLARVVGGKNSSGENENRSGSRSAVSSIREAERDAAPGSPFVSVEGSIVGTLCYMPPEQANGQLGLVGPRSDVYAVGAMLYELIASAPPYTPLLARMSPELVLNELKTHPPQPLFELAPRAPGELIAICERAMEREIANRYADMQSLAADLRAYIEGHVVRAHATGTLAETRKWVTRNKALAAALASVVLAVSVGGVSFAVKAAEASRTAASAIEARNELAARNVELVAKTEEANRNASETQVVAEFQSKMLSELSVDELGHTIIVEMRSDLRDNLGRLGWSVESIERADRALVEMLAPGNPTNVAQHVLETAVFEPAVRTIDKEYSDRPLLAAKLQTPLAETLRRVALLDLGERTARAAMLAQRERLGGDHPSTLTSIDKLAELLQAQGRLSEAEPLCREALAGFRATLGDYHPYTLGSMSKLASLLQEQGKLSEAEPLVREVLSGYRTTLGNDHPNTLRAIGNLALLVQAQGKLDEAEPLHQEALAGLRVRLGDTHLDTLKSIGNLCSIFYARGRLSEIEPLIREELAGLRFRLGDYHPDTLVAISNMGALLYAQGKLTEAEPYYREALASFRAKLGTHHPATLRSMANMALLLQDEGRFVEAEAEYRDALAGFRGKFGEDHPDTLTLISNFASLLQDEGKCADAEAPCREALGERRARLGNDHPATLESLSNLGLLLQAQGELAEAEQVHREALEASRAVFGDNDLDTLNRITNLAVLLTNNGDFEEAEMLLREAFEGFQQQLGAADSRTWRTSVSLVNVLMSLNEFGEAARVFEELLEQLSRMPVQASSVVYDVRRSLREVYQLWRAADPSGGHEKQEARVQAMIDEE